MPTSYEVCIDSGSAGISRAVNYAIKRFDFGDGFYESIITGDTGGVRIWTVNLSKVFRDTSPAPNGALAYRARYYGTNGLDGAYVTTDVPTGYVRSRPNYWWYFIQRRMEFGDPFWFVDPATRPQTVARPGYLCSIIKPDFDMKQDSSNALRYSFTVQFQQARGWVAPPGYGKFV